jgi:hypothetical protein
MRMNHKVYVVERHSKGFSETLRAFTLKKKKSNNIIKNIY